MEFMNRITDKMGWEEKVFDEALVAKWKAEVLEAPEVDISEKIVDWASTSRYVTPVRGYQKNITVFGGRDLSGDLTPLADTVSSALIA